MGGIWSVVVVLGPILLGMVLIWAIMRNRKNQSAQNEARSEAGARNLYDQLDREDRRGGSG